VRFLTDGDVAALVTPADALAAVRAAFTDLGSGTAAVQRRERTEVGGAKLSTLGAVLPGAGVLGAKVYSTIGGRFTFLVALFSADDGRRLAVLESDALTRLRTAATSVLSTELLLGREPGSLVVLGRGQQATGHLEAFRDRWPRLGAVLVGREPPPGGGPTLAAADELVGAADVVVTATRATGPLFDGRALAAGAHVCAVGTSRTDARELDVATFARASVVAVELVDQACREAGGLLDAVAAGAARWEDVTELGPLAAGASPVVRPGGDVTVFQSVGIGIEDVAVAAAAWRAAERSAAGTVIGGAGT
jgi:ornithine cyclodeaminase